MMEGLHKYREEFQSSRTPKYFINKDYQTKEDKESNLNNSSLMMNEGQTS